MWGSVPTLLVPPWDAPYICSGIGLGWAGMHWIELDWGELD